ncbi:MAG: hypothetical protein HC845_12295, partial [Akkermansiaceae bacterium]|nr:hypothetical protein [Akkermansiaceae bacterium]
TVFMPGDRRVEIRDARGKIAGIHLNLDARVILPQQKGAKQPDPADVERRRAFIVKTLKELEKWKFDQKNAPTIHISAEGDLGDFSTLSATLTLQIKNMKYNGHQLNEVAATAEKVGDVVTINQLTAKDASGSFDGHIDYNLRDREGRFDISSSLEIPKCSVLGSAFQLSNKPRCVESKSSKPKATFNWMMRIS